MFRKYLSILLSLLVIASMTLTSTGQALAQGQGSNPPSGKTGGGNLHGKVTPADRLAAAKRLQAAMQKAGINPNVTPPVGPGTQPDYFGTTPNYANSALPTVTGGLVTGGGIRKFVDALPQLTSAGINDLGQYIPEAVADTTTYAGDDYYEIALVQYSQKMNTDIPATTLRGYVQIDPGNHSCTGNLALHYVDLNGVVGAPILDSGGLQVCSKDPPQYLGPLILAHSNKPVRIKFTNYLPTGAGGNLFLPTDITAMGAGTGPTGEVVGIAITNGGTNYSKPPIVTISGGGTPNVNATAVATVLNGVVNTLHITNPGDGYTVAPSVNITRAPGDTTGAGATASLSWVAVSASPSYTQNRATIHLHGGVTPWISDGTPDQWITPAAEGAAYPTGVSVVNVPDMPDPGPGSQTFFYSNQQSARLMFYHDHSYGITRLTVYSGQAAGYLLTDSTEAGLISGGTLPDLGIPLVIQDKTFVPPASQLALEDPTWDPTKWGGEGNLWFPHVYMPNQNPFDEQGVNAVGRWDYGPWFWPPYTGLQFGPQKNLYAGQTPLEGPVIPGTPTPSMVPEGFMDTPLVNGTAYPTLNVPAGVVRFRILNASNDRMWNLQLYQATGVVGSIVLDTPGSGYTDAPAVTITPGTGDTTGEGAEAITTVDPTTGLVTGISLWTVGSGYTVAPNVTIAPPTGGGTAATAHATLYTTGTNANPTEVGMVPFNATQNNITPFPTTWYTQGNPFTLDDRNGGVPDPTKRGPAMVQIGTEGGFLPEPVVIPNQPVNYVYNRRDITVLNVAQKALMLGPAERADVLVDFTNFAGKTLIMYNDSPAPVPASDPRNDYFTGDPDQTSVGGAPTTMPGYGPNTRTIMQIVVGGSGGSAPVDDYNTTKFGTLKTAIEGAFKASQPEPIVPEMAYNNVLANPVTKNTYSRISDSSLTFTPDGQTTAIPMNMGPKAIQELFTVDYGRMNATLGVELPNTNQTIQTTIPFGYIDPATELLLGTNAATPIGALADGTQIWKITHNGVDTHAIHFHLFNVQLINRVGWDGAIRPPDPNELGWKDTVRMSPLEDAIVALRPIIPTNMPFPMPNSIRMEDVTRNLGSTMGYFGTDPNGNPSNVTNQLINFGWEYVWHCHLLGHEENDMMRPMMVLTTPNGVPSGLTANEVLTPVLSIVLNWTNNATNASTMTILRATDALFTQNVTTIDTGGNLSTYTDTAIAPNTSYFYKVAATNTIGGVEPGFPSMTASSAYSAPFALNVIPAAPTNLVTILVNGGIKLTWMDNAVNEAGFDIVRKVGAGAYAALISVPANPGTGNVTYTDTTTLANTTYTYGVRARNVAGPSAYVYSTPLTTPAGVNGAPTNLTAVLQTGPKVLLTWADHSTNETGFSIERRINGGAFAVLTTVGPHAGGTGNVTYTDPTVLPGNVYGYQVRAFRLGSNSAYTNIASVTVPALPAAPTGLTVVAHATLPELVLTWTDNATNETSFVLQRSINGGAFANFVTFGAHAGTGAMTYTDAGATIGRTYAYRIDAVNLGGSSAWSNTATLTASIPAVPTTFKVVYTKGTTTDSGLVSWVNAATNATSLQLYRANDAAFTVSVVYSPLGPTITSHNYTGLTPAQHYYFRIRAVNGYGTSAYVLTNGIAP